MPYIKMPSMNSLNLSSFNGHEEVVKFLLAAKKHDINTENERTHKSVQMILEHGADVNAQGGEDETALQAASSRGHDKIVQMLLEHEVDQLV
ncbi:hypothetical protein N7540_013130 [Penicillium herquei]|nr:hypothetical protein N7540_013130 [Penicillium herquei]